MIKAERLNAMHSDFWAESIDPRTEEWRQDLTAEEREVVAAWDALVDAGCIDLRAYAAVYPLNRN